MKKDNKDKVYEAYDKIVHWYDQARTKTLMESDYLELIVKSIPAAATVLDLGCGTGEPIAKYFIEKGCKVTGIDGSKKMIELCQQRFPHEKWIVSDMREINLLQHFDAILAWHSFFHLDQESQRSMFALFNKHIKPGGILAFTSGEEAGECWADNGGQMLYHASLSTKEYEKQLTDHTFKILLHKKRDPHCGEATVWLAQSCK